jgi:DNA-binding NtrC family response regulator
MLVQIPVSFAIPSVAPDPITARDLTRGAGKRAPRVLVVDDEPLVRWAIGETLRTAGYEVDGAGDADGTLHALVESAGEPDVVLLDVRLPDCSDLSLLEAVRLLAPAATVILMTSYGTPEMRERATGLGAACVLDKPFDVDSLDSLISGLRRQLPFERSNVRGSTRTTNDEKTGV